MTKRQLARVKQWYVEPLSPKANRSIAQGLNLSADQPSEEFCDSKGQSHQAYCCSFGEMCMFAKGRLENPCAIWMQTKAGGSLKEFDIPIDDSRFNETAPRPD